MNYLNPAKEQFHLKNGGDAECVCVDGYAHYSNGAMMENSQWGAFIPPPEDPRELAKAQFRYWTKKRYFAHEEYATWKQELIWRCQNSERYGYPGPSRADIEKLEVPTAAVQKYNSKLQELQELMEALKPGYLKDQEEGAAANKAAAAEARDQIVKIKP